MRAVLAGLVLVVAAVMLSGCASPMPMGVAYTELTLPIESTGAPRGAKMGEAKCTSILGLVATGDASIEAAARNGNITTISHVDWEARNILGIIGEYRTIVYGE